MRTLRSASRPGVLVWRVRRDHRALEHLARVDGLTGLFNRRTFESAIESECTRARRTGRPLCVETVAARLSSFCAVHDPRWAVGAFDFSAGIVDHAFDEPVTSLFMRSDAAMCHQKGARRTRSP